MYGHDSQVNDVAFSPDGRLLASGGSDRTLRIWNADTRETIGEPMTGHAQVVFSVAFSPDGQRLVSGSWDSSVRVWNVGTRQPIGAALTGHRGYVFGVAYSPDGNRIASGGEDGSVRLWPASASPQDLCDKLMVNMSHKQWREWVSPDFGYEEVCPGLPVAPD